MLYRLFTFFLAATETINPGSFEIPKINDAGQAALIRRVLTFVYVTAGAISLLMVVLGGIRYIVSVGDPQKIATAKNTILYALVGLVISLSAFVITGFIFDAISDDPTEKSIGLVTIVETRHES